MTIICGLGTEDVREGGQGGGGAPDSDPSPDQALATGRAPGGIFLSLDIKRNCYKSRGEECLCSSALMFPFLQRNVDISLQ